MSHSSDADEQEIKPPISENKKKKKSGRKGRLIVRNLPFKVNEETLRNHFKTYGEITEVNLLRKPNGKLVGCGFIQFTKKNHAAKAILSCSGKPLLGRVIIVDWAVPKKKFAASREADVTVKTESEDVKIKEEPLSEDEDNAEAKTKEIVAANSSLEIKEESDSNESETEEKEKKEEYSSSGSDIEIEEIKEEKDSDDTHTNRRLKKEESERSSDDEEEEDDDGYDDYQEEEEEEEESKVIKKPRTISNDVSEGRTVFVKNVPFRATNEELKECMEQFGPVIYALVCIDPLTEHSKGTAFVKFQKKESAEECLSAGTELMLHDQVLDAHQALHKEELQRRAEQKKDAGKNKDSRNLYLVKEGVIMAGSKAAVGVSVADMAKRLQLEQWKTQMLRNLNMFVSRIRLVVHNIPPIWTDSKLHQLFLKHAGPKAKITEARIMRDMKNVDAQGVGKSKEYGFVTFTTHEHALHALRNINNNPNIFSKAKRPIVAFSIENKAILNIKQRRLQKSKAKNPLSMDRVDHRKLKGKGSKGLEGNNQLKQKEESHEEEREEFAGVTAQPGKIQLPSRFKLKKQAALHIQNVRKTKQSHKLKKRAVEQKLMQQEKMKDHQPKRGKKRKLEDDDRTFNSLVSKYKQKLMSAPQRKWYDS